MMILPVKKLFFKHLYLYAENYESLLFCQVLIQFPRNYPKYKGFIVRKIYDILILDTKYNLEYCKIQQLTSMQTFTAKIY